MRLLSSFYDREKLVLVLKRKYSLPAIRIFLARIGVLSRRDCRVALLEKALNLLPINVMSLELLFFTVTYLLPAKTSNPYYTAHGFRGLIN